MGRRLPDQQAELDRKLENGLPSPLIRIARLAILFALALGLLIETAPVSAHLVKASANGTVTGSSPNGPTLVIDVKLHIKNKARKRRDIGCDFTVRRNGDDLFVGSGFAGAVIRGRRSKDINTEVVWLTPSPAPGGYSIEIDIEIDHCHTY